MTRCKGEIIPLNAYMTILTADWAGGGDVHVVGTSYGTSLGHIVEYIADPVTVVLSTKYMTYGDRN